MQKAFTEILNVNVGSDDFGCKMPDFCHHGDFCPVKCGKDEMTCPGSYDWETGKQTSSDYCTPSKYLGSKGEGMKSSDGKSVGYSNKMLNIFKTAGIVALFHVAKMTKYALDTRTIWDAKWLTLVIQQTVSFQTYFRIILW